MATVRIHVPACRRTERRPVHPLPSLFALLQLFEEMRMSNLEEQLSKALNQLVEVRRDPYPYPTLTLYLLLSC